MRRFALPLLLALFSAAPMLAKHPPSTTWADRAQSGNERLQILTDCTDATCSAGGGSTVVLVYWDGSTLTPISQVVIDLDTDYGNETITSDFDFGGGTLQVPNSTSLPGTCEVGDSYMDTDATSGQRFYLCESANTWALQGDGGGGGSGDVTDVGDCSTGACFTEAGTGNSIVFEGATADVAEITLTAADPGGDFTVTLPAETGTVCTTGSVCTGYDPTGGDDLSDDLPTAHSNVTTITDGDFCQGNAGGGFDCDVSQNAGTDITADLEEETHAAEHANGGGDAVDHDTLTNFVSNEHVDHSSVNVDTASPALTGGGDLTATRTLDFLYTSTLAGNPAMGAEETVFSTDGTGGGLIFEGLTADTIEGLLVWSPTTSDKTITLPDETGTVCTTGSVCTGYDPTSGDDLSDDLPTALSNVTTINDGDYCQGNAGGGFDCDVTSIPDADVDDTITASNYLPLAGGTITGTVDFNDGTTDSPTLTFTPQTATPWNFFADESEDVLKVEVNTATLEELYVENTGAGAVRLVVEGHDSVDGVGLGFRNPDPDTPANICYAGLNAKPTNPADIQISTMDSTTGDCSGAITTIIKIGDLTDGSMNAAVPNGWNLRYLQDAETGSSFNPNKGEEDVGVGGAANSLRFYDGDNEAYGFSFEDGLKGADGSFFIMGGLSTRPTTDPADTVGQRGYFYIDIDTEEFIVHDINGVETSLNKPVKSMYWPAGSLSADGTNCADPTEQTLNSGPKLWAFSCADNAASIFYGNVGMPDSWDGGTVTFELQVFHETTETITFAGDFSAQCRGDGEVPSSTWGTAQAADVAITTANQIEMQTSAAVTAAGTCAGGDHLFWRYVVDDTNFSTNAANAEVVGVKMEYGTSGND